MEFSQFNKDGFEKIVWPVNTEGFKFKKLSDYWNTNQKTIQVFGFFFVKSKNFGLQPIAIAKDCLVNLPTHKCDTIKEMLKNNEAVEAIKRGECSLFIRQYQSAYQKTCFDFNFVNTPLGEVRAANGAPSNTPTVTNNGCSPSAGGNSPSSSPSAVPNGGSLNEGNQQTQAPIF